MKPALTAGWIAVVVTLAVAGSAVAGSTATSAHRPRPHASLHAAAHAPRPAAPARRLPQHPRKPAAALPTGIRTGHPHGPTTGPRHANGVSGGIGPASIGIARFEASQEAGAGESGHPIRAGRSPPRAAPFDAPALSGPARPPRFLPEALPPSRPFPCSRPDDRIHAAQARSVRGERDAFPSVVGPTAEPCGSACAGRFESAAAHPFRLSLGGWS
jgi:hypothetical protein